MNKNIVNDSLFFGMRLGGTRQNFYNRCWQLNKEGMITQGPQNNFVKYVLPLKEGQSTTKAITMLFYGVFNEDKIMTGMDLKFYYSAWSLWNKSFQSDKLVPVVKDSLQSWFPGNGFIPVYMKKNGEKVFVKIDGTRRIIIEPLSDSKEVNARIDDLRYLID